VEKFIHELRYGTTATYILIGINLAVFILTIILPFFRILPVEALPLFMGASHSAFILSGDLWRTVTSAFLHIQVYHILLNMIALYYFGRFVELYYSSRKVVIIYVITGIAGSLLAMLENGFVLGASGAIYGLVGTIIGGIIRSDSYSPGVPVKLRDILPSTMFWLFIGLTPGLNISFWGHLGGFVAGIGLGLVLDTVHTFRPNNLEEIGIPILFWASCVIVIVSYFFLVWNFISLFFS
jgi:rhomboid protease GluP